MEREYIYFNNKYLPSVFGLKNLGNTCYFNSFLQALLTCTSFNKFIIDYAKYNNNNVNNNNNNNINNNNNNNVNNNNILLLNFYNLLKKNNPNKFANNILNIICNYENNDCDNNNKLIKHNPNDSDEVLGIFFNYLSDLKLNNILSLFKHRQKRYIHCTNLDLHYLSSSFIENNVFYLIQDNYKKSDKNFAKFLLEAEEYVSGNICKICEGRHNSKNITRMTLVSEIIIIRINRYTKKNMIYKDIPESFRIPVHKKNNYFLYKAIAFIERKNGHYYTVCKRNNNNWYTLNDNKISNGNFNLSPYTYLIFYHLYNQ